jgi:aminodeoxyfutalosine synthase
MPVAPSAAAIDTPRVPGVSERPPGIDERLDPIRAKVERGERLTLNEGELLFSTPDLSGVLEMADAVRRRLHGNTAFYNVNRHLNYSNVCALSCKFCEFYRKEGEEGSYTRDMTYVREQARRAVEAGATEMHCVGGLHPALPFSYYTDLIATIHDEAKRLGGVLHVKAFTAVEIVHLCRIAKVYKGASAPGEEGRLARREAIRFVLGALKSAGLGSLPGGGAEVFDDRVHDEAYKGKIRSDVWLDVHRVAHEVGLHTNATLLYGHIECRSDRLVHMDMLRRAQDEALTRLFTPSPSGGGPGRGWQNHNTPLSGSLDSDALTTSQGGHLGYFPGASNIPAVTLTKPDAVLPEHFAFSPRQTRNRDLTETMKSAQSVDVPGYYQTIIPLPFFPDGCELEHLPGPSGLENLRTLAVARLMLDNFPHVKAFWIMQTLPMAQLMLQCGADDIDGTVVWYDITKLNHATGQGADASAAGGGSTHQEVSVWTLHKAIIEAGFEPVERDTLYRRVVRDSANPRAWSSRL